MVNMRLFKWFTPYKYMEHKLTSENVYRRKEGSNLKTGRNRLVALIYLQKVMIMNRVKNWI